MEAGGAKGRGEAEWVEPRQAHVAIAAGRLLADRLFAGVSEKETTMDYDFVPTAVFSHPPLSVMGFTEAQAREKCGDDEVTVHKSTWST